MRKGKLDKFLDTLFVYGNYRDFLKDYFSVIKSIKSTYSIRYFAERAGFSSHTFFSFVINGKRNLSEESTNSFITAIGMDSLKGEYFKNLVLLNQSKTQLEQEKYYDILQNLKKKSNFKPLKRTQAFFYEKPHHAVIRELVVNSSWSGDFTKLASMVLPTITVKEAKDSVKGMVDCGILIEKNGTYQFKDENIYDDDVPAFLKKKTRRDVFERGVEVLDALPPSERFAAFSTFMVDRESYKQINDLFLEFRSKVNDVVLSTKEKKEVFQFTFELFPVSTDIEKKEKR